MWAFRRLSWARKSRQARLWRPAARAHAFRPPFNCISAYREPGRINLNTIYTQDVFNGLMYGFPGIGNTQHSGRRSCKAGEAISGTSWTRPRQAFPTEFAQPFRSYGGGQMVPLPAIAPTPRNQRNVAASRSRSDANRPLFQYDGVPNPTPPQR